MVVILNILSAILSFILAVLVFRKNKTSLSNISFAIFSLTTSVWALAFALYYFPIIFDSLFWIKVVYLLVIPMPIAMLYFAYAFPNNNKPRKLWLLLYSLLNVPIVYSILFTNWFVAGIIKTPERFETSLGIGYLLVLVWVIFLSLGLFRLVGGYISSKGIQREQFLYIFLGLGVFMVTSIVFDALTPLFLHTSRYFFLSCISSLVFVGLTTYAIIKHRLFDIRFIIIRVLVYASFITFLVLAYVAIVSFIGIFFNVSTTSNGIALEVLTGFIIIVLFIIFQRIFQRISKKLFYIDRYNPQVLVAKIGEIIASSIELSHISEAMLKEFLSQMKINAGSLVISWEGTVSRVKQIGEMENPSDNGQELCKIIEDVIKAPGENVVVKDEIAESGRKQLMEKGKYSVILPLIVGEEAVGALILGSKISGQVYSTEDVEILKILAPQIAAAIKNALSYDQTKQFNLLLQVKIENATENLKNANDKLMDLDKLKDEFVSITSHELRTPMTVIKGYVWRILNDKKEGEISEKTKQRLQVIYDATEREIALVNDVLNISRIEAGTMIFDPKVFNIGSLAEIVKKELSDSFTKKKISLMVQKTTFKVNADEDNIHQVFVNLLANALKFTNAGGKVKIQFKKNGEFIETAISDTGTGIEKNDLPKLFTKFGRLGNTLSPDSTAGTGLGLYICKKMIERSRGNISVKSIFGKGSTFIFDLPNGS